MEEPDEQTVRRALDTQPELVAAAKQALAYVDSLSIGNQATERLRVAIKRASGELP